MNRISKRISSALSGVKCPGCNKFVVPTLMPGQEPPVETQDTGRRWSFVWRPPSGEVCPECFFPLARYSRRVRWIRLFTAGVVLLTISFLLYLIIRFGSSSQGLLWVLRTTTTVGLLAFLVGLVGLIVGGRSTPGPIES